MVTETIWVFGTIIALGVAFWLYKRFRRNALVSRFRDLAEAGDADAQFEIGVLYQYGRGVPQNLSEAVSFYSNAAEQGHLEAQSNLGILYASGQGIPVDYVQALHWFTKAADQGDAFAQNNLCRLYSFGEGVPRDYITAYMWIELAIGGLEGTQKKKAEITRDSFLASHMNPEEIERAKTMADDRSGNKQQLYSPTSRSREYKEVARVIAETYTSFAGHVDDEDMKKLASAEAKLFSMIRKDSVLQHLMQSKGVDISKVKEIYWIVTRAGYGQWVEGNYVPAAAIVTPYTLSYLLGALSEKDLMADDVDEETQMIAWHVLNYFERKEPLP